MDPAREDQAFRRKLEQMWREGRSAGSAAAAVVVAYVIVVGVCLLGVISSLFFHNILYLYSVFLWIHPVKFHYTKIKCFLAENITPAAFSLGFAMKLWESKETQYM